MTVMTSEALWTEVLDQHDLTDAAGTSPCATTGHPVAGELARLLFEGSDRERIHGTWRKLISGPEFAYRPGLSPTERATLSYDRLRLLNNVVDDPEGLAAEPHRLAALHEWIGPVDGGLTTLASIHYNLFLGSAQERFSARSWSTATTSPRWRPSPSSTAPAAASNCTPRRRAPASSCPTPA